MHRNRTQIALVSLFLWACDEEEAPASRTATIVRDSAGVAIVQNVEPPWEQPLRWTLSSSPIVAIGGATAGEANAVYRVRGAVRLSDGRIVVANGGTQDLRYFDREGRHLGTVGRKGAGPGEFSGLGKIFRLPADTILAFDGMTGRLSKFSAAAEFLGAQRAPLPPTVVGRFDDGSLAYTGYANPADASAVSGALKPMMAVIRASADGNEVDTIAEIAGAGEYRVQEAGRVMTIPAPFAPAQPATIRGDRFYTASMDGSGISVLGSDGAPELLIRPSSSGRQLSSAEIEEFKTATLEAYPSPSPRSQAHARVLAQAEYPQFAPAYTELVVDSEGCIWAALFTMPGDEVRTWQVYDPAGRWLAGVALPASFRVEDIGRDYVLGVATDDLDVEQVQLYSLNRK